MPTLSPAETFLAKHTEVKSFSAIERMIKAIPFADLPSLLTEKGCELPHYFYTVQKKLSEVEGAVDEGQLYKVKLEEDWKELPLAAYKELLQESLRFYRLEAFFKETLRREVSVLLTSINATAEVIASNKGMDDSWVQSALRDVRSQDRRERKNLKALINTLTEYGKEHGLRYG